MKEDDILTGYKAVIGLVLYLLSVLFTYCFVPLFAIIRFDQKWVNVLGWIALLFISLPLVVIRLRADYNKQTNENSLQEQETADDAGRS